MKDLKILHFGDWHARPLARHEEYRVVFNDLLDIAKNESVDVVFFGGDLIHDKLSRMTPELIGEIHWMLSELNSLPGSPKVFVTLGNHDGNLANRGKRDYVSPIVKACNLPNIILCRDSGNYEINEFANLCNFSVFDDQNWDKVFADSDKINIAAYHGPVTGCQTEMGYVLDGDIGVEHFDDYDYTLLADIHKRQFLNEDKTIGYCGSTIQQNFGETVHEHGVLVWTIRGKKDFDVKFVEIKNRKPFLTYQWQGSVAKTINAVGRPQVGSRVRIQSEEPVSESDISLLKTELSTLIQYETLVFDAGDKEVETVNADQEVSNISLKSSSDLVGLVVEYYGEDNLNADFIKDAKNEIEDSLENIDFSFDSSGSTFEIEKVEFDNLFVYGESNSIDFTKHSGIVGIFGPNRSGKSTILAAVLYSLFGELDREAGQGKNHFLINKRSKDSKTSIVLNLNDSKYKIERRAKRNKKKSSEKISLKEEVKFFEIDKGENVICDLSGEKPSETNKLIFEKFGTSADFLLTTISAQDDMKRFLKSKNTARKQTLAKFLSLEVLDKIHANLRIKNTDCKSQIKALDIKDWETIIENCKKEMKSLKSSIEHFAEQEGELSEEWAKVKAEHQVASEKCKNIVTKSDVKKLQNSVDEYSESLIDLKNDIRAGKLEYKKVLAEVNDFDEEKIKQEIESLSKKLKKFEDKEKEVKEAMFKVKYLKKDIAGKEKTVLKLKTVPCGNQFPNCKYISDSHAAKGELQALQSDLDSLESIVETLVDEFNEDLKHKIQEKLEQKNSELKSLESKLGYLEKSKPKLLAQKERIDLIKEKIEDRREKLEDALSKVSEEDNESAINELKKREEEILASMRCMKSKVSESQLRLGKLDQICRDSKRDWEKYKKLNDKGMVLEKLLHAFSPKGFPSQLLGKKLQFINLEIAKILRGVTDFSVDMQIQEGTDKLEIFLSEGGTKVPIEVCSGMEKNIASIAIRVAMSSISQMPKTNMLMFDETFDAFDESAIDMTYKIFFYLKKWFKSIYIIAHNESVKNIAEQHIEIQRRGLNSYVNN